MSTDKHLDNVAFQLSGLLATPGGDAAREALANLMDRWVQQKTSARQPTSLVSMVADMTELVNNLAKVEASLKDKLTKANSAYFAGAVTGTGADLDAAKDAGADLLGISEHALNLAASRTEPDYQVVRKILEHIYGDANLPTFDGMAALGHSVQECIDQVKHLETNKVAVEKGIELPDMFKF